MTTATTRSPLRFTATTYRAEVTPDGIEWAKKEREQRDQEYGAGYSGGAAWGRNSPRWKGALCERAFAFFLEERDILHEWNGGIDARPDFIINNTTSVGVKHTYSPRFARIDERHKKIRLCDWYVFFHLTSLNLTLLGTKHFDAFFAEATFIPKGGKMLGSDAAAFNAGYELAVESLDPIETIL